MKNNNLRGSNATNPTRQPVATTKSNMAVTVSAPAAVGSVLRGMRAQTKKKSDSSISLSTSVCVGRPVGAAQVVNPELIAVGYVTPLLVGNDEIQNMARVYQHYRVTKASIEFRSFQGTSAGGEVIIIANDDPNYRPIDPASNSFYQRAISTDQVLLTPTWMSAGMDMRVDSGWKVCDNANSGTLEEFASGVFYIYQDGSAVTPGYFILNYDIEFEGLRFNSRQLISGSLQGLSIRKTFQFNTLVLGAPATASGTGLTAGDVYSFILNGSATYPLGVTATNLFVIATSAGTTPFTVTGSTALYARASSTTDVTLHTTYDSAVGGDGSDKLLYGVTNAGVPAFFVIIGQLRNSTQPSL